MKPTPQDIQPMSKHRVLSFKPQLLTVQMLGQSRGVICSSNSAIRCSVAGSLSPSFAVRRIVSAIALTCAALIGSGRVATAAFIASFMMPMVSGGKLAFEEYGPHYLAIINPRGSPPMSWGALALYSAGIVISGPN
jgi:hypothetical protein